MIEAAAIILAGGKSSRMGENKALVRVTEYRMLESIIQVLQPEFAEIILSANDDTYAAFGLTTVRDIYKNRGPLGGIYTGLKASGFFTNFIAACDMPFTDVRLARYMAEIVPGYDAVVPKIGEYYQPLFAVYTKNCLQAIEEHLKAGRNKITSFFGDVRIRYISIDEITKFGEPEKLFFNVNTPVDLHQAKVMAGREGNGPKV